MNIACIRPTILKTNAVFEKNIHNPEIMANIQMWDPIIHMRQQH